MEKKEITKEKIGRSPDDADALNLAYCTPGATPSVTVQQGGGARNPLLGRR